MPTKAERLDISRETLNEIQGIVRVVEGSPLSGMSVSDLRDPSALAGCDLLVHEMGHHQPEDIAAFAQRHRVPRLLLSHIHPDWDHRSAEIVQIAGKYYEGETIVASDGLRIPLGSQP